MGDELPPQGKDLGRALVRQANHLDVVWIADHMRRADIREVMAVGKTPYEALRGGLVNSRRCVTIEYDGTPVLMAGVADDMDAPGIFGAIWMLATDDIRKVRKFICKEGQEILRELGAGYHHIGNGVAAFNTVHIRWIRWMGFQFYNPFKIGDVLFYSFGMVMDDV